MNTYRSKRAYSNPSIELVELDNDISLTLDSSQNPWADPSMLVKGVEVATELLESPLKSLI